MFGKLFGGCGCGGFDFKSSNSSCDVLWIIILLLILFEGGLCGLDICTLIILFIVFGGKLGLGRIFGGHDRCERHEKCC